MKVVRAMVHTTGVYSRAIDYVVDHVDPAKLSIDDLPDGTFAIQFFEYIYATVEMDGEVHPLKSGDLNPSPLIFIAGKLLDRQQLAEDYPDMAANIIRQMNEFDHTYTVLFGGKFKSFNRGDLFWPRQDHQLTYYDNYGRRD